MENTEFKAKFDNIQRLFDRCISHAYETLERNIYMKSQYLNTEQVEELEGQEYIHNADELASLYMSYSVLSEMQRCYFIHDFFWESGFYEALKPDEKRKYLLFSPLSFDYSRYEQDNTVYDEELPYFSVVVKTIVLERYSAYLRKKKESKVQAEMQPQQKEPQPIQDKYQEPKIISHIAETENPFKSILNDRQIALLVDCINEVEIFNAPMTFEDLKAILSCKPKVIFRSNNNRQVAFLFSELSNRGLITPNWQSVIAKNKLFVTKNIKKDKYLNQGDLATAANYVKGVEHEKDYVTISNYIKQLKKL